MPENRAPGAAVTGSAIVVGAGIFGISIADHLAGSGWDVEIIERHHPGHPTQSSGGETRLIRCGHGEDAWYTAMAWRARTMWGEIEDDTGADLLVRSGVVWFGSAAGWVTASHHTMGQLRIPSELIDEARLRRLFPSIDTSDIEAAVYEPEAGVLRAAHAVEVLARRAQDRGARLTNARAQPDGAGLTVDGVRRGADVVVWACGPWLPRLFPELVEASVTKQDVVFYRVGPEWAAPGVPGWIDLDRAMYGCGDVDGRGFKASSDIDGPDFDPDTGERLASTENLERCRRYLARRFPGIADAAVTLTRTCQYTSTADGQWIIAPHPEHPQVWLVGAGSGHGFKHGPALGEYVAALIDGRAQPEARLGLGPRSVAGNLRTGQPTDESHRLS
ncbi:MAG: FAD-dependent oxidoreductase [Actinomycetota bacterium]|nr:FAD-dependent oxidoreductase [Actinomycetota bacterium]